MLNELQHLRPLNAGDRNRTGTVSLQQSVPFGHSGICPFLSAQMS